jgi:hypothetical protein
MGVKHQILKNLYGRWPANRCDTDGYAVMLLIPSDMPFLLRLALEGLGSIRTENCREILVICDPFKEPYPNALAGIVGEFADPRVRIVRMSWKDSMIAKHAGHAVHWLQVVNGIQATRCRHAFLHDADAFFLQANALERQYRECRDFGFSTLGVQARKDEFFQRLGMRIPGTWELMFDVAWARSHAPIVHRGYAMETPDGWNMFDNMLYPQYAEYAGGKVGIMNPSPLFVHFSGTIFQYRRFLNFPRRYEDELCRVLLLSILERSLLDAGSGARQITPSVDVLMRGLTDPTAPVTYLGEATALRYATEVRPEISKILATAAFASGDRRERAERLLDPFDRALGQHPAVLAGKHAPMVKISEFWAGVKERPGMAQIRVG